MSGTSWFIKALAERPDWPDVIDRSASVLLPLAAFEEEGSAFVSILDERYDMDVEEAALVVELLRSIRAIRHLAGENGLEV